MKQRVISGIQPTGCLHLGNYLGAIKNWINLQDKYDCYFFIADLHAITNTNPELHKSIFKTLAMYLACDINPEKVTIFVQSDVKDHLELAWIFSCYTPIGWLNRMTQFKDKSSKNQQTNLGLLSYPVLMAADILLYQTNFVPVGDDQKQHLELTRDIALLMNKVLGKEDFFTLPEPLIDKNVMRIMSLKDGTNKMSKSDTSEMSRINLTDSPDVIKNKIKKAKTDSLSHISYDLDSRPEISNLITIFNALSGNSIQKIIEDYNNLGFAKFKQDLADLCIDKLSKIQNKYDKYIADKEYLSYILNEGKLKAEDIAKDTMSKVKKILYL